MRNGSQNHHQQQHSHHLQHIGYFLPMLCSKSSMIKDVHIPNPFNKDHSASVRRSEDPSLSPKVGCMGQVKKKDQHHNNYNYKLGLVFPTTTSSSTTSYTTNNPNTDQVGHGSCSNNFSYSKLLRLFSSKTLLTSPSVLPSAAATKSKTTSTTTISCRQERVSVNGVSHSRLRSRSCEDNGGVIGFGSPINVADLDPPLPVVIKKKTTTSSTSASLVVDGTQVSECDNNSLWKRRSGGAALKGLQIQQVHIPIQSTTSSI